MKQNKTDASFSIIGYFLFWFPISITVICSIALYNYLSVKLPSNLLVILIMGIAISIFTLIFALIDIYRRKIMVDRPVEQILDATEKLSNGNFNIKLVHSHSYDRFDKYDLIMANFNKMAEELSKSEVLKADFIANVSHEIKTPLAIIQNYAKALTDEKIDTATKKSFADSILKASTRLSNLVSNILKLNKLEHQSSIISKEKVNVSEQLIQAILDHEEMISEKKLGLNSVILEDICIYSAPNLLEIVWNNLISNAIKFTDEFGTIEVSLNESNGYLIAKISDTGCGISPETGKHIFEKFYQGDTSHASEGNGLGLAMVKRVIDILGGEISVESELNVGTTFIVKLKMEKYE